MVRPQVLEIVLAWGGVVLPHISVKFVPWEKNRFIFNFLATVHIRGLDHCHPPILDQLLYIILDPFVASSKLAIVPYALLLLKEVFKE